MSAPRSGIESEPQAITEPLGCLACAGRDHCRVLRCHRLSGRERLACGDVAYRALKEAARPSPLVSAYIHTAPARGPMLVRREYATVEMPTGGLRRRMLSRDGFHSAERADAFDVMEEQARRRKPDAAPLFTVAQILAGRTYAALAEQVACAGVKASKLEKGVDRSTSGGTGSWIDTVMGRSQRLARMHERIGNDVVLAPRGAQAHADRGRRAIYARHLIDEVCCEGRTISDVLRRNGWSRGAHAVATVKAGLTAALDRLWGV